MKFPQSYTDINQLYQTNPNSITNISAILVIRIGPINVSLNQFSVTEGKGHECFRWKWGKSGTLINQHQARACSASDRSYHRWSVSDVHLAADSRVLSTAHVPSPIRSSPYKPYHATIRVIFTRIDPRDRLIAWQEAGLRRTQIGCLAKRERISAKCVSFITYQIKNKKRNVYV